MNQQIYWHTTTEMPGEANTITPIPEKADVAVIGGGYTGLSAARTLTPPFANVRAALKHV